MAYPIPVLRLRDGTMDLARNSQRALPLCRRLPYGQFLVRALAIRSLRVTPHSYGVQPVYRSRRSGAVRGSWAVNGAPTA
jgi:hypothetical protein